MKFTDYISAHQEAKELLRKEMLRTGVTKSEAEAHYKLQFGFSIDDWESLYKLDIAKATESKSAFAQARLIGELKWYRAKRPYFNVYPIIEKKLLELNEDIDMSELKLPFPAIEIRTSTSTVFVVDYKDAFVFVLEFGDGKYQEFLMPKKATLKAVKEAPYQQIDEAFGKTETGRVATEEERHKHFYLAAGTCLLARDPNIISPVILNEHRRDQMTPAEVADYAARAIKRNGRIGFDIGREIERLPPSAHYRNGCFAKYYVGPDHQYYPENATSRIVPIVQWRSGAVVKPDDLTKVPTGFKDGKPLVAEPVA